MYLLIENRREVREHPGCSGYLMQYLGDLRNGKHKNRSLELYEPRRNKVESRKRDISGHAKLSKAKEDLRHEARFLEEDW